MFRKRLLVGLFIAASFFFLNIPLLSSYGLNWDEPTHYLRGQAFLRYFLSGKTDYKDLPTIEELLLIGRLSSSMCVDDLYKLTERFKPPKEKLDKSVTYYKLNIALE